MELGVTKAQEESARGGWKFTDWYEKHKDELSAARKAKYATDPAYRADMQARAANYRQRTKEARRTGSSLTDVSEAIGVSPWSIGKWRAFGFIPVIDVKDHQFTQKQIELLTQLRDFFTSYKGRKHGVRYEQARDILVSKIHNTWS